MSKLCIRQSIDQFHWVLFDGKSNIIASSKLYDTRAQAIKAAEEHAATYAKAFTENYVDQTHEAKISTKKMG